MLGIGRLVAGLGDTPPLVESLGVGQPIRGVPDMSFTETRGAIPEVPEQLRQGVFPGASPDSPPCPGSGTRQVPERTGIHPDRIAERVGVHWASVL